MDEERRSSSITIWAVRIAALAIALALLSWSSRMEGEFRTQTAARLEFDWGWFWRIQLVNVLAGIAFAAAVRFPFPRPRFAWGRLAIAGLVFLPVVHVWLSFSVTSGPEFLRRFYWIDNVSSMVWSILAGVAIGAGFGARRAGGETVDEAPSG